MRKEQFLSDVYSALFILGSIVVGFVAGYMVASLLMKLL